MNSEESANTCPVQENTDDLEKTISVADKSSETGIEKSVDLEVESNEIQLANEVVSGKSNEKIHVNESQAADVMMCSSGVKMNEIEIASSSVNVKAEAKKTEELNVTPDEGLLTIVNSPKTDNDDDLVQMVNADAGTADNANAVTNISINDDGSLGHELNNELGSVAENTLEPKKHEPSERGKRKQGDNEVILLSSGSDTDLPTTSKGRKQPRTDPAEEKKRLIQLICAYPVLYDSNHSDVKRIGSKKAAYQDIGNKMGLTRKFYLDD